jgi:ABC-type nitrate/sulfonate/bicarbonate transport system permease component
MSAVVRRLGRPLLGVAVLLALLAFWELWARGADSFLVPAASTVAERAWHVWPSGEFLGHVAASLRRLAAGYAIGAGVGVAAGLVLGASQRARRATEPVLEFLRAIPPIAIVPALIVVLGVGDGMRVAVIAFGVLWPVLLNSVDGVRAVSPELRDTAALLQTGRVERVVRVYLPAALPSIFAGLRIALGVGLVMVVISEFVGGGDGIGHYIILQQTQFRYPETYAGILFLGVLGYVLNALFLVVERRLLAWHHGAVGARAC